MFGSDCFFLLVSTTFPLFSTSFRRACFVAVCVHFLQELLRISFEYQLADESKRSKAAKKTYTHKNIMFHLFSLAKQSNI